MQNTEFDKAHQIRDRLLKAACDRLATAATLDEIMDVVRSSARAISGADGVTFVLREGSSYYYADENGISPLWKGQRFPMTLCISGWCMMSAKTAAIADVFADERIPHDVYRQTYVKSLVMTPVSKREPVAAIGLYWSEHRTFSDRDIATAEALA